MIIHRRNSPTHAYCGASVPETYTLQRAKDIYVSENCLEVNCPLCLATFDREGMLQVKLFEATKLLYKIQHAYETGIDGWGRYAHEVRACLRHNRTDI
jgi:hypothetical protein